MQHTAQRIALAIKAEPEAVWSALVDGSVTPAYYMGYEAQFDLEPGSAYRYASGGTDTITGAVLEVEPGQRLRTSFNGHWDPAIDALPESTVTFSLAEPVMPVPGVTVLTCVHEGLPDTEPAAAIESGWVFILSGLKTLLETGAPMAAAPAAAAGSAAA